jgi:hypothetical protein
MTPQIEKVIPEGTNRFGSLSDNWPVVLLLITPMEARVFKTKTMRVEMVFEI